MTIYRPITDSTVLNPGDVVAPPYNERDPHTIIERMQHTAGASYSQGFLAETAYVLQRVKDRECERLRTHSDLRARGWTLVLDDEPTTQVVDPANPQVGDRFGSRDSGIGPYKVVAVSDKEVVVERDGHYSVWGRDQFAYSFKPWREPLVMPMTPTLAVRGEDIVAVHPDRHDKWLRDGWRLVRVTAWEELT